MAEQDEETQKRMTFGPMGAKAAPERNPLAGLSQTDIDRIAAAIRTSSGGVAAAEDVPEDVPEEDKAVLAELSRVHPSAHRGAVTNRVSLGNDLYVVEVSYQLSTGAGKQQAAFLVYDNEEKLYVFKAD